MLENFTDGKTSQRQFTRKSLKFKSWEEVVPGNSEMCVEANVDFLSVTIVFYNNKLSMNSLNLMTKYYSQKDSIQGSLLFKLCVLTIMLWSQV